MLEMLSVKNLAVVREAQMEFGSGLNILTGETGAGKSVVIGGVNLAMGRKAAKEMIRDGAKEASCQLVFYMDDSSKRDEIEAQGFQIEEERLIVSRRISSGRSICRIGGEMVTASKLREISAGLIDIHGQHDSRFLLNPKYHLNLLDDFNARYGSDILNDYRTAYHKYKALEKELSENDKSETERLREISFLEYETGEIEAAHLQEGEDAALEEQFRMMSHAGQVLQALSEAQALAGPDGAGEALQRTARTISAVTRYGSDLEVLYDQAQEVSELLDDLQRTLRETADAYCFDEADFAQVRDRLDEINRLKLKYGQTIPEILHAYECRMEELEKLRSLQEWKKEMLKARTQAYREAKTLAEELSLIRKEKAKELEKQVEQTLSELNFLKADLQIVIEECELNESGADSVSFLISANPGETPKPLEKVSSGGELSRIMLALHTVSAMRDQGQTLIFDEIDSGISGRTAQKVAELLKRLSGSNQVICITHLPQIAAMADRHFLIEKTSDGDETISSVRLLDEEESTKELARMLGGARITQAVMENAAEMKRQAASADFEQNG